MGVGFKALVVEGGDGFAAPERYNIMTVGESGLGKTTLIECLLQSLEDDREDKKSPLLTWESKKTVSIAEVGNRFIAESGPLPSYCHIFDSPGYGDLVNNMDSFDIIRDDLVARHAEYAQMIKDEWNDLSEAERKQRDTRIHCCLYFIAPHRMKQIDVEFILYLSEYVVVVPVIAKADTMTRAERHKCLTEVKSAVIAIERIVEKKRQSLGIPDKFRMRPTFNFGAKMNIFDSSLELKSKTAEELLLAGQGSGGEDTTDNDNGVESVNILNLAKLAHAMEHNSDDDEDVTADDRVDNQDVTVTVDKDTVDDDQTDSDTCLLNADPDEVLYPVLGYSNYLSDCSEGERDSVGTGSLSNVDVGKVVQKEPPGETRKNNNETDSERITRYRNIFAVVADPSMYRDYKWGVCRVDDPDHSDFPLLRDMLFHPNTIRCMIEETRGRSGLIAYKEKHLPADAAAGSKMEFHPASGVARRVAPRSFPISIVAILISVVLAVVATTIYHQHLHTNTTTDIGCHQAWHQILDQTSGTGLQLTSDQLVALKKLCPMLADISSTDSSDTTAREESSETSPPDCRRRTMCVTGEHKDNK